MLPWDPSAVPAPGWCSGDQDLRATGPWGTNLERNLVTKDPPLWRSGDEDAGSGPLVTRLRAKMVPWGPSSPVTWSLRNHLARCSKTPGPQGTRICVQMVPRGSASRVTWSLVHHPWRRPRRPGHERTSTRAKLVPKGPSSRAIWSLRIHVVQFRRMSAGGMVTRGPCFEPGWSPKDQIVPST